MSMSGRRLALWLVAAAAAARLAYLYCRLRIKLATLPLATWHFDTKGNKRLADMIARVKESSYNPPFWATSPWINMLVHVFKERTASSFPLKRNVVALQDGGVVSVAWADDYTTRELRADAPVLVILHTGACALPFRALISGYLHVRAPTHDWRTFCFLFTVFPESVSFSDGQCTKRKPAHGLRGKPGVALVRL